jgi:hypothetical protein
MDTILLDALAKYASAFAGLPHLNNQHGDMIIDSVIHLVDLFEETKSDMASRDATRALIIDFLTTTCPHLQALQSNLADAVARLDVLPVKPNLVQ